MNLTGPQIHEIIQTINNEVSNRIEYIKNSSEPMPFTKKPVIETSTVIKAFGDIGWDIIQKLRK